MTSVNPVAASATAAALSASTSAAAPASSASMNGLSSLADPNTFLKLLVAQLKYQNPLNPTSGTQFLSQTAQLTEVSTMSSVESTLKDQMVAQQAAAAANLVGRTVSATAPNGSVVSGTVISAALGATPTLDVGGSQVPLSAVTSIS